jgi:hypothetical protein
MTDNERLNYGAWAAGAVSLAFWIGVLLIVLP